MASNKHAKKSLQNMDEILEFLLDDNDPESDVEVDLGDELSSKELDSGWEHEKEPQPGDTRINYDRVPGQCLGSIMIELLKEVYIQMV